VRVVRLLGHRDDAGAWQIRDFLKRSVIEFRWIELSTEEDCRREGSSDLKNVNLPVVELPDGTRLFGPTLRAVADRLGFVAKPKLRQYDVSIYGAGPAGLSAAVYARARDQDHRRCASSPCGGVNPITKTRVVDAAICHYALAVMTTAGWYETSGDWLYDIGLPGKSGISGGIVTVSPGKGGLGTFAPPLDKAGHSVKGKLVAKILSQRLGMDLFVSKPEKSEFSDPRCVILRIGLAPGSGPNPGRVGL
jgi:hypothetical protein